MSMRYPGGFIASTPVTAAYPSGVWTQAQAIPYQAQNVWTRDQFWPYTTLLLQGDGAVNGAQNNTFLDSSSNNFTITRNGNTTQGAFTPYEQDGYWSNYFDGSGDYLTTPSNTAFAFGTGDFTVEAFVFITATNSQNLRVFTTAGVGSDFAFEINTSLQLAHFNGSTTLTLGGSVPLNQWVHIAWVRSGSTVTGYINGVSIGTATSSANMSNSQTISIGATANYTSGQTAYISNLRVVKGTAVYTSAFTPSTAPLTAITNTSLLTCQSNRFKDNSTNNFTLTRNGDTSVQAFQPFPGATTWSASVLGGSGYFDGSGDNITAPSNAAFTFGTGDFTVEMWVYTSSTANMALVDARSTGTAVPWALYTTATALTPYFYDGSSLTSSIALTLNAWNHVAVARSSGTLRIFVNGVQGYSAANSTNISSTGTVQIGGAFSGAYYTGYISDLRIIKGTAVYTAAFTPPTAPLTAIANTSLLCNFTNAGIFDAAVMNDLETVGNAQVSTSVVKYGTGSIWVNGSGNYLAIRQNEIFAQPGDFTVECWAYFTASSAANQYILSCDKNNYVQFGRSAAGKLLANQGGVGDLLTGATTLSNNTWYHLAMTRSGSTLRLFVNGTIDATGTYSTSVTGLANPIGVGALTTAPSAYATTGYIDDLRFTQGYARYITNFTPPIARLPAQ